MYNIYFSVTRAQILVQEVLDAAPPHPTGAKQVLIPRD